MSNKESCCWDTDNKCKSTGNLTNVTCEQLN